MAVWYTQTQTYTLSHTDRKRKKCSILCTHTHMHKTHTQWHRDRLVVIQTQAFGTVHYLEGMADWTTSQFHMGTKHIFSSLQWALHLTKLMLIGQTSLRAFECLLDKGTKLTFPLPESCRRCHLSLIPGGMFPSQSAAAGLQAAQKFTTVQMLTYRTSATIFRWLIGPNKMIYTYKFAYKW